MDRHWASHFPETFRDIFRRTRSRKVGPQNGLYRDGQYQNPLGGFWWYRSFWWFWWFWSSLALKFGFYKKFNRQNWLEIVEGLNPEWLTPEWVLVLVLVVLVVVLVVLAVVS